MISTTKSALAFLLVVTSTLVHTCNAFGNYQTHSKAATTTTSLNMDMNNNVSSRKAFIAKVTSISAAAILGSGAVTSQPAEALFGSNMAKINTKLSAYGLPEIKNMPDGFTSLLEIYGKAKNREPLLVQFQYPVDWVTILPNVDANGEEGTIQAGQMSAGDTATLYVTPGKIEDVTTQSKTFFKDLVIKAISQKGDNMYEDFKLGKIEPVTGEFNNQKYELVDFKYTLLTGAGFAVDRVGVASVTSQGNNIQVLWAASTRQRFKKTESTLRTITSSFRCFSDGIQFSI